jgi:hypothetical protein
MTVDCLLNSYNIRFTDSEVAPIVVSANTVNQNSLDIALFGQSDVEYGELFDENLLHLLENFACPAASSSPATPDLTQATPDTLSNPNIGQAWYNLTNKKLYFWNGTVWMPHANIDDIAALSGVILSGNQIPAPVSSVTGYTFKYSECVWFVSPYQFPEAIEYMECVTDSIGNVTSNYVLSGGSTVVQAYANFIIIGIKNNNNLGTIVTQPVAPPITLSPTPTPSVTPSVNSSPQPTPVLSPTPSATVTITPSITPTITPSVTVSTSSQPLNATLFLSPSTGFVDPNFGTNFGSYSCPAFNATDPQFILRILINGITGGVGPYTVDYSNINISAQISSTAGFTENMLYSGGFGSASTPIRTALQPSSLATMEYWIYPTSTSNVVASNTWTYTITNGSFVKISDSVGNSIKIYTPTGYNGNVYGTSYRTPVGNFIYNIYVYDCYA